MANKLALCVRVCTGGQRNTRFEAGGVYVVGTPDTFAETDSCAQHFLIASSRQELTAKADAAGVGFTADYTNGISGYVF